MDSRNQYNFKSEFNDTNDNLIATLNRKNLNSLNAQFAGINLDSDLDIKQHLGNSDNLLTGTTGEAMYKSNRQNGAGTDNNILLHSQNHSRQQHSSSVSSKSANQSNKSVGNTNVKNSTLPKTGQLNQLNQLNQSINGQIIDENVQCSMLIRWICSPPLLCIVLFAYVCFGALLFHHLEAGAEILSVTNVASLRNNTLHRLWNSFITFNLLYPRNWTANATTELIQFERAVIYMVSRQY